MIQKILCKYDKSQAVKHLRKYFRGQALNTPITDEIKIITNFNMDFSKCPFKRTYVTKSYRNLAFVNLVNSMLVSYLEHPNTKINVFRNKQVLEQAVDSVIDYFKHDDMDEVVNTSPDILKTLTLLDIVSMLLTIIGLEYTLYYLLIQQKLTDDY